MINKNLRKMIFGVFMICFISVFIVFKYYGSNTNNVNNRSDMLASVYNAFVDNGGGATATPKPCSSIGNVTDCNARGGCSWDYTYGCKNATSSTATPAPTSSSSSGSTSATATPKPCDSISGATECSGRSDCSWDYTYGCKKASSVACSVTVVSGSKTLEKAEKGSTIVQLYIGPGCGSSPSIEKSCSNCSISVDGNYITVTAGSSTCTSGASGSVSVNGSASASISVGKIMPGWGKSSVSCVTNPQYTSRSAADRAGADEYYEDKDSEGCYKTRWSRGCGGGGQTPTPTPTTTETPTPTPTATPIPKACYGDKKYLGIATNVGWQEEASTARPYKYDGVKEEDCRTINVSTCSVNPTVPLALEEETSTCEDVKEIKYHDITKCSNYDSSSENSFYTIDCVRQITTTFDYGDDNNTNTSRFLYKGQGFKFGVNVTSVHTCTAKFNKDAWLSTYNRFLTKVSYISSSLVTYIKNYDKTGWTKAVDALNASKETKSEVYALWNIIENLRNIVVDGYLGFVPKNSYEEQVSLALKYNVNGKSNNKTEELIISEKDSSEGEYTKTVSNTKYNLTSQKVLQNVPESYVISNENNPRVLKFLPQNAYIDKYLGLEISVNDENAVDGGNKIYIDYNIDATTSGKSYNMTINVTGLGSNRSSVINNKCDINVGSEELLYRPIEVNNPFINSKWDIGENWLNDRFSFTNTIKSDTWSTRKLYDITLSNEDILDIKESNRNNKDKYPYLGLCDRLNINAQDSITKKLCEMIGSTID